MKKDYQKALRKLILSFLLNPVPFNGQSYQKQKGSGTSDQSLFRSQNKFRKIPLFAIYYLTILMMGCKAVFELFQTYVIYKLTYWSFPLRFPLIVGCFHCKSIHDIINYCTSIFSFESGKCRKEGKKLQKFEHLENKKSFLDEIKTIFIVVFKELLFGEKIKIW